MANTTWNPSDKGGTVALSGGNLVATLPSSLNQSVRSVDRQITGKFYFEITAAGWQSTATQIGIANAGATMGAVNPVGSCIVQGSGGGITLNGVATGATLGTRASGDIIGFAVDLTNQLIWFRAAPSGNWNGNASFAPGGTGGINITSISGGIFPVLVFGFFAANTISFTLNSGDTAFSGAVPSGFTSGFTADASPPINELATQLALEEWGSGTPDLLLTQVALEEWATVQTVTPQLVLTQIVIEQWAAVSPVVIPGNNFQTMVMVNMS
jgi:hypothetical protein